MPINAYVLAVGPYRPHLADKLEADKTCYADCPEGGTVFNHLFYCRTSDASRQLTVALGTTLDSFGRHQLKSEQLLKREAEIRQQLENHPGIETVDPKYPPTDLDTLFALCKEPGWRFFLRPS